MFYCVDNVPVICIWQILKRYAQWSKINKVNKPILFIELKLTVFLNELFCNPRYACVSPCLVLAKNWFSFIYGQTDVENLEIKLDLCLYLFGIIVHKYMPEKPHRSCFSIIQCHPKYYLATKSRILGKRVEFRLQLTSRLETDHILTS